MQWEKLRLHHAQQTRENSPVSVNFYTIEKVEQFLVEQAKAGVSFLLITWKFIKFSVKFTNL